MAVDFPVPGAPLIRKCCGSCRARGGHISDRDAVASDLSGQPPRRDDVGPANVSRAARASRRRKNDQQQQADDQPVSTAPQGA